VVPLAGNRAVSGGPSIVTGLLTLLAEIAPPDPAFDPATRNEAGAPVASGAP
jgi:hypothetical protein